MAVEIDDSGVQVDYRIRQGDAWPREPFSVIIQDPDGTPIPGSITSARLMARTAYDGGELLADLDSANPATGLSVSDDGSTAILAAGCVATDDWPVADRDLKPKEQLASAVVWDLELTMASTGKPETFVPGTIVVLPQVTHD